MIKIFVPEHGFRGLGDAGEHFGNAVDSATGLPVISLYGEHKAPNNEDLKDVEVFIYDLQDVGVRFYTYISTLQYCMEACAGRKITFMILDRPNPNGFYVSGPVLDTSMRSFVGMQPVPVVYGMTAGEYARMLVGERWMNNAAQINLTIIPCANYSHSQLYTLEIPPSPNLKDMAAVYAYPSLCFFEGTVVSVGRGTAAPFKQYGHPKFDSNLPCRFTPVAMPGAMHPPFEHLTCYGECLGTTSQQILTATNRSVNMEWLIKAYNWYGQKPDFFNSFFDKLAGTKKLKQNIIEGKTAAELKQSWQKDIDKFMKIRKKYILYPDFK